MDSLKSLGFSSFIIFSDDHWSLLVSFCQLFKLSLIVKCCDVICEWPLICGGSVLLQSKSTVRWLVWLHILWGKWLLNTLYTVYTVIMNTLYLYCRNQRAWSAVGGAAAAVTHARGKMVIKN